MEARFQVGIAMLALAALAALLFGRGMRVSAPAGGWVGLALLVVFAAFTGLSFAWSIAPDGTWSELNRAIAYVLVTAVALVVGSTLARPLDRAALGFLVIASAVPLSALAGKAIPGAPIGRADSTQTPLFPGL